MLSSPHAQINKLFKNLKNTMYAIIEYHIIIKPFNKSIYKNTFKFK